MSLRSLVHQKDHIQGNPAAHIELVEYGDYQCPHCGVAYPIVKHIQQSLGDSLKFVFRNFPLSKIHPQATMAAIASEAAALQGKYWEMHDILFENQTRLNYHSILLYAETLGLDLVKFELSLKDPILEEKVKEDFYNGMRSGVDATPTFFINNEKYTGSWHDMELLRVLLNTQPA